MPQLYIFDMGGVVSTNTNVLPHIARHLGLDVKETDLYSLADGDLVELMRGLITEGEFWRRFSRRAGRPVEEDLFRRFFHPRPVAGMAELVAELREEARVVVGTNTIEPHYRVHAERGDYGPFDRVYASHRMGLAKPDPAFYLHILNHEGCAPGEAAFVDDLSANVEAAARLGIAAFLFTDVETLRRDLAPLRGPRKR